MPAPLHQYRKSIGTFQNHTRGAGIPSHDARMAALHPRDRWLRVNGVRNTAVTMLALLATLPPASGASASPAPKHDAGFSEGTPPGPASSIRGVMAPVSPPAARSVATAQLLPTPLTAVSNGVMGVCVTRPRHCAAALAVGAFGAGILIGRELLAPRPTPAAEADLPATDRVLSPALQDNLVAAVQTIRLPADGNAPPGLLGDVLLDIARACKGDQACRDAAIHAALNRLGSADLQQLEAMVAPTGRQSPGGWPPGAEALPLIHEASLETLVQTLSAVYTPEVAQFQDDMERIVRGGQTDALDAGAAGRREAIRERLAERGYHVFEQPFTAADRSDPTRLYAGTNLQVTLRAPTAQASAPARHLMLVAHGDVKGAELGSEGAYDNAAGVASLLHVLGGLDAASLPSDTAVSVLITDLEERHLLGSEHFVAQCTRSDTCPTLVINVDLVGRGGHGFVLSTALELAGHYYIGRPPMNLAAPTLHDAEGVAVGHLLRTFAAHGFERHPTDGGLLLTSDNLAFSNASIPTLGLAQMSADDAHAMGAEQQASIAARQALDGLNWTRYTQNGAGAAPLSPEQIQRYEAALTASNDAWDTLTALRVRWPNSAGRLIHSGNDRISRVSAPMGVAFSDALLEVVRQWIQPPSSSASPLPDAV